MPEGATTGKLYAMAILTGIGFTMSLFIGTLAFDDEAVLKQVRLGVLVASLLSGIVAALLFCGHRADRTKFRLRDRQASSGKRTYHRHEQP